MAATTGFRTLYPAIIPPGACHVHGVHSAGPISTSSEVFAGAVASSLLSDFFIRSTGISNLYGPIFESISMPNEMRAIERPVRNFLRLNCLTSVYAPLWEQIMEEEWNAQTPLRNPLDRQLAQTEIDVSIARLVNVTVDELCMIYRTQFPVMRGYDEKYIYDKNGRRVPPRSKSNSNPESIPT